MHLLKELMDSNTDTQESFSITAQPIPELKWIKSTSLGLGHSLLCTIWKFFLALEKLFGRTKYNFIRILISFRLSLPSLSPLTIYLWRLVTNQKNTLFELQDFISFAQSNTQDINQDAAHTIQLHWFITQKTSKRLFIWRQWYTVERIYIPKGRYTSRDGISFDSLQNTPAILVIPTTGYNSTIW